VKGKVHSITSHEGPEGRCTLSLTRALYPEKEDPVPIVQEAGWAPGPV